MLLSLSQSITASWVVSLWFMLSGVSLAAGNERKAEPHRPSASQPKTSAGDETAKSSEAVPPSPFVIMPSEIKAPANVALGQYRRIIQPFPNWILVCDENLKAKQKICNVSQTFVGPDKAVVFSWSLAATQTGQPYFILRAPPSVGARGTLTLALPDGGTPVHLSISQCSDSLCLAYQPAGRRFRSAAEKRLLVTITYTTENNPTPVTIAAPLYGLVDALAAI